MQNPVFIQFKDFLKRSNSMVRIIEFCVFFHLVLECSFLKISSQCNGSISSLRPPTDLLVLFRDLNSSDFLSICLMDTQVHGGWIKKYLLVINSKIYTQYQSDFLVFSHAWTLRFCIGRFIKLSLDPDGLSAN